MLNLHEAHLLAEEDWKIIIAGRNKWYKNNKSGLSSSDVGGRSGRISWDPAIKGSIWGSALGVERKQGRGALWRLVEKSKSKVWRRVLWWSGFPGSSDNKKSFCNAGDLGLIRVERISWRREYWLQYSCLENSMDRGALQVTVHRVAKNQTRLSD